MASGQCICASNGFDKSCNLHCDTIKAHNRFEASVNSHIFYSSLIWGSFIDGAFLRVRDVGAFRVAVQVAHRYHQFS